MQLLECTIIIVNWNSWDYLFQCLEALSRQTYQEFHVIVVDNASSDQSQSVLLEKYTYVTFVQNTENIGFAAANNQAVQLAGDSKWIVLLNPDTVPEKDWLENLLLASKTFPDYSFFGSRLVMADNPQKLDGDGDVLHMSGLTWRAGHGLHVSHVSAEPREIFAPCAAAAMYRREDLLAVGGFDEDFFCYNEDIDLGFRLRITGHRALSVPDSIVLHHGSGTTSVRSDFAVYHGHRNLVWTWFKDMPLALLCLFLPAHLIFNFACLALYTFRGQGGVIFRSKRDAIIGLPGVLKKRKEIFAGRHFAVSDIWGMINKSFFIGQESKYGKTM